MAVTFSAKRNPTLVDIARGRVDGKFDRDIVDLVLESNDNLGDFVTLPCNDGKNDVTTIRTGIPDAAWASFYEGVQPSKGEKAQVVNTCGHLESLIQVDARLCQTVEGAKEELGDEAYAHGEAMGNEVLSAIFYGDTKVNGKKFNGLSPVYSAYDNGSQTKNDAAYYCITAKRSSTPDSTALRSIWIVGHGRMGSAMLYPKGSSAGLKRGPVTDNTVTVGSTTNRLRVKEQFFDWDVGFRVKDFRKNFRICNIESNNLTSLGLDLGEYLLKGIIRMNKTGVRPVIYMPTSIYEYLCIKARQDVKTAGNFAFQDFEGKLILTFQGVPIKKEDSLEVAETAVSAAS